MLVVERSETCDLRTTLPLARRAAHHDALGPQRLDLTRPVPLSWSSECLEVALQAPTGGNRQGWHWVVVTDPELLRRHRRYEERSYDAYRGARHAPSAPPPRLAAQQRVVSSSDHLADHLAEVPVLVLACIEGGAELPAEN